jgi:GDP-4-dehydro-6-deoxy-D-mannose reductase
VKKVLFTGGTGALGRAVIGRMNQLGGYQVITAGRQDVIDSVTHMHCDVGNHEQLSAIFNQVKPDLVLHLAATFTGSFDEAFAINVTPAKQILELVQHNGLNTRVVLLGSAAEYGVVRMDENPIRENRVLAPVSIYGVSKAWQTQLLRLYSNQGLNVVCARVFNLIGPGVSSSLFAGRLQNQINEVLAGKKTTVEIGSLTAVRDYISTDEAAIQLLAIAKHGEAGEIYHVASGVPVTMREILISQMKEFGLDPSIVREAAALSNHKGYDVPVIYADVTKTKKLLAAEEENVQA